MAITYKYKTIRRPDNTEVKTPSIPITLKGEHFFDTIALIDSGADVSAINETTARILGLDMNAPAETVHGIGGAIQAKFSKMAIIIERRHERYEFKIPVQIILGD